MTILNTNSDVLYTCDNVTVRFPFKFKIFEPDDLGVFLVTGTKMEKLVLNKDYQIPGVDWERGGDVVTTVAYKDYQKLYIRRQPDAIQETSFRNLGSFYPAAHEDAFDKIYMLLQWIEKVANDALKESPVIRGYWDFENKESINCPYPTAPDGVANAAFVIDKINEAINNDWVGNPLYWDGIIESGVHEYAIPGAEIENNNTYRIFIDGIPQRPNKDYTVLIDKTNPLNSKIRFTMPDDLSKWPVGRNWWGVGFGSLIPIADNFEEKVLELMAKEIGFDYVGKWRPYLPIPAKAKSDKKCWWSTETSRFITPNTDNGRITDREWLNDKVNWYAAKERVDIKNFIFPSDTDHALGINRAFEYAKYLNCEVYGSGSFDLKSQVTAYCDFDFSGATFNMLEKQAVFNIVDDRDDSDCKVTFSEGDFDKTKLTRLSADMSDVFNDPDVVNRWANSLCVIKSTTPYVYRSGVPTDEQPTESIQNMGLYGRLHHTLSKNFASCDDVTIEFYKMHPKTLTGKMPFFEISNMDVSAIKVTRNNTKLDVINADFADGFTSIDYAQILQIDTCTFLEVDLFATDNLGVTNNQTGVSSSIRYDCTYKYVTELVINKVRSHASWKTLDGNSSRGIKVLGGVLGSLHGHYNCADITISNTKIIDKGVSVGTGAPDSVILLEEVEYLGRTGGMIGLRSDYAELQGEIVIRGGIYNTRDTMPTATDQAIVGLKESAIHGKSQPVGVTYSLPKVKIDGLKVRARGNVRLVQFNDQVYTSLERLELPDLVSIQNVDCSDVDGYVIMQDANVAFNHADEFSKTEYILNNIKTQKPMLFNMGQNYGDARLFKKWKATIGNAWVTSDIPGNTCFLYGDKTSELYINKSTVDAFDLSENSVDYLGVVFYESCNFNISEKSLVKSPFHANYSQVVNCTFDGTEYYKSTGSYPDLKDWDCHNSNNNVGLNVNMTGGSPPSDPTTGTSGKWQVVNGQGGARNFRKDDNGVLTKS